MSDDPAASADPALLLEQTFRRFQDELLGTLYCLSRNREDARDALQEAFVKCWNHRDQVPGVVNLKAWVFQIALNTARDLRSSAWKRRSRALGEREGMIATTDRSPVEESSRREQLRLLRTALQELRSEEQEIFLMRQNGDMTYEEIAAALDLPVGTVKTRMRMALANLRKVLAP